MRLQSVESDGWLGTGADRSVAFSYSEPEWIDSNKTKTLLNTRIIMHKWDKK